MMKTDKYITKYIITVFLLNHIFHINLLQYFKHVIFTLHIIFMI
jgi:hypothetical protein